MLLQRLLATALSISSALSAAVPTTTTQARSPRIRTLLEQERGSWLENIVIRPDGTILATRLDKPELWLIEPTTGNSRQIATFAGVSGAFGIAEYAPDVFAVVTGNLSLSTFASAPDSYSLQTIDLSRGLDGNGQVTPTLLAQIPGVGQLNGLTFRAPSTLYISDSYAGNIYSFDLGTRATAPITDSTALFQGNGSFGSNGLRWDAAGQQLLFTNTALGIIGRLRPVANSTNTSASTAFTPPEVVASANQTGQNAFDDFALVPGRSDVFAATNVDNTLTFVSADGQKEFIVAGGLDSTELAGVTSAAFGRREGDRGTLYVTTGGGQAAPVVRDGVYLTTGARVLALECVLE